MVVFRSSKAFWLAGVSGICALLTSGVDARSEEIELRQILVEGDPQVVTEGTDRYTADRATVGGRQPQDIRDIPQTVSVLTRQTIEDSGSASLEELTRVLPSLSEATGDGFVGSLYTRGQEVFQYYIDGVPRPFLSIYGTAPDLHFFDRVEVMSGPSGVFQGSGEPVGTVNLVRKRPTREFKGKVGASVDTFGGYRGEADFSGALNEDGTILARIVAYGNREDSFVDHTNYKSGGVYGTLEFELTPNTTLAIGSIYEKTDPLRHSGLPTYTDGTLVPFSMDTFIGSTDNSAHIDTLDYFAELEHTFDNGSVLKATGRVYERDSDLRNLLASTAVDPATGNFSVFWFAREYDETSYYADVNLTSPIVVSSLPIELVTGIDYRQSKQGFDQNFDFSPGATNIATFDPTAYPVPAIGFPGVGPGFRLNTRSNIKEVGIYGQARVELTERLKVNLGARYSIYDNVTRDIGRGIVNKIDATNLAPYAGVTFDVVDNVTLYASYATIFQPQIELKSGGTPIKPRQGTQYEAGVKTEWMDGALTAQASAYLIEDVNRASPDPANAGFFIANGKADTKGLEFLVTGKVYEGFEIIGGYSIVETDLLSDPTPEQNFSLFSKYSFEDGTFDGLELGAGVRVHGKMDNVAGGTKIKAAGATIFDLYAAYAFTENVKAQVNVYNVFDKKYIRRINETTRGTYYGDPLNAKFKVVAEF